METDGAGDYHRPPPFALMPLRRSRIRCIVGSNNQPELIKAWDEGSLERHGPLMTINNVHVLASGRAAAQLVLADRSQADSAIAVRAIRRLFPDLEVRPVTNLAEAESVLTCMRLSIAVVASGLDSKTWEQTIRWFASKRRGIVVAMLEDCDDRQKQEALEAGASCVWSKPELLVAQLRYELAARLDGAAQELAWMTG